MNVSYKDLPTPPPSAFIKLRHNQEAALSVLLKIADVLDCGVGDMWSLVKDEEADIID